MAKDPHAPSPATGAWRAPPIGHVRGLVRLAVDGVAGVTRIAQGLHGSISSLSPPLGSGPERPAGGIAGLVYGSIRTGSGLAGRAADAALAGAERLLESRGKDGADAASEPPNQVLVSVLNGVLGDHLERTHNPLAIQMQLRVPAACGPRLLLLVHGLCMGDAQWRRKGHDHGEALAQAHGYTPVYVRYNSGRHVSENGAELAAKLEALVAQWPVGLERIAIVGHSMGGLVARSAVHQAQDAGMAWPGLLRQMVFLGTPHHGAALERGGNWLQTALGASPYLVPFVRLGRVRSDGITDLRHGNVLRRDWEAGKYRHRDTRAFVPLPAGVACYAVAGVLGRAGATMDQSLGDGLVTVDSAMGRHVRSTHDLHIPVSQAWVARGVHHLDLLSSRAVYERLHRWLAPR